MTLQAICRNCNNTGIGIFDGKTCKCPTGQALVQFGEWKEQQDATADRSTCTSTDGTLQAVTHGEFLVLYRMHPGTQHLGREEMHVTLAAFQEVAAMLVEKPVEQAEPERELPSVFLTLVQRELNRARRKHTTPLHSHHEAYAVVKEEIEEAFEEYDAYKAEIMKHFEAAWQEVRMQVPDTYSLLSELVQIAAMCQRWYEDLLAKEIDA